MLVGSSLKYENQDWTDTSRPISPDATSSATACQDGWRRYMKASMSVTPSASARRRSCARASSAVRASGFSHRTCLPARAAAIAHSACRWFGQRDVDRVDLGVGEQRLVGARGRAGSQARRRPAARPAAIARGDGHDVAAPRLAHAGHDLLAGDVGGRQDPPAQRVHPAQPLEVSVTGRKATMPSSVRPSDSPPCGMRAGRAV